MHYVYSKKRRRSFAAILSLIMLIQATAVSDESREDTVRDTLYKAVDFYSRSVAVNGGFVYYYSPDLQKRLGEGVASATQVWVQPPGTPTVGMAFLRAFEATGEQHCLQAASACASSLIYGQLESGAWTNSIDFDPKGKTAQYRNGKGRGRNFSTLDDGISQAAIQFLIQLDQKQEFNDSQVHKAAQLALNSLLNAQFANGAFPQGWDGAIPAKQPVLKATFPSYDWKTEGRIKEYWDMYTLNDGISGTVSQTLLLAYDVYGHERYLQAAKRLGNFLILAQMPDPQPAWAQQYSYDMHPIWARRFEPAAIAGRESQDAIRTLLRLFDVTKDKRLLEPVPRALNYLKSSLLPDGRLARYYELKSNRPLYMSRDGRNYKLTYDDSRLPRHYGWKVASELVDLEKEYQRLLKGTAAPARRGPTTVEVDQIVNFLDSSGRWISRFEGERLVGQPKFRPNQEYISSQVFSDNVRTLAAYLQSLK